ncbi:hypothetical protein CEXT_319221 [Caerostris extrusa]|uniref:Uncharacterized protein n=1 Tax=Caerostris extrusa TaxID=172846 RepID=A0AAV4QJ93_CAEEX|nr:hypothetical protein CEXT_319221 [Caerostris extrusa]
MGSTAENLLQWKLSSNKRASFGNKETDVRRSGRQIFFPFECIQFFLSEYYGERLFTLMSGVQSVPIRSFDWKMLTPEWAGAESLFFCSENSLSLIVEFK